MEFRTFIVNLLLVGLVTAAIVSFAVTFASDTSSNVSVTSEPTMNRIFGNLSAKLNDTQADATANKVAVEKETGSASLTAIGFAFSSILNTGTIFISVSLGLFNILFEIPQRYLGVPPIITGILLTIIIVSLVLAAWSVWRAGR